MRQNLKAGIVEIKERDGEFIPYEKNYQPDEKQRKPYSTWIDDIDNSSGSVLEKSILGDNVFNYPKPVDYLANSFGRQKAFFPDYILGADSGIWIIETKGGFDRSGNSEDIDIYSPVKFAVLKEYLRLGTMFHVINSCFG